MTSWEHVRSVTEWARFVGFRGSFNMGTIVAKGRAIAALVLLVGCGTPNPLSSAQGDCERINEAAWRYFHRCERTPSRPLPDCSRVWGYAVPVENIDQCIAGFDAAECGLTEWPAPCPRTWVYLPL